MKEPLVSVICLCYNHAPFVKEALESVLHQTYTNKEIIVVDDASKDASVSVISELIVQYPEIIFIRNEINEGNCKSFNKAFKVSRGKYIIDLATDDVLLPTRIEKQVKEFESLPSDYGVVYGDVISIDCDGAKVATAKAESIHPSGDLYYDILRRYFISTPSMMVRREVLEDLGGYDETLAYEDFDFWVRSSRKYYYHYQKETLTKKRTVPGSHSTSFLKKRETKMSESTYRVVLKALWLNKNEKENAALAERIRHEMSYVFYMQNFSLVNQYYNLLKRLNAVDFKSKLIYCAARLKVPVFELYRLYTRLK